MRNSFRVLWLHGEKLEIPECWTAFVFRGARYVRGDDDLFTCVGPA